MFLINVCYSLLSDLIALNILVALKLIQIVTIIMIYYNKFFNTIYKIILAYLAYLWKSKIVNHSLITYCKEANNDRLV